MTAHLFDSAFDRRVPYDFVPSIKRLIERHPFLTYGVVTALIAVMASAIGDQTPAGAVIAAFARLLIIPLYLTYTAAWIALGALQVPENVRWVLGMVAAFFPLILIDAAVRRLRNNHRDARRGRSVSL